MDDDYGIYWYNIRSVCVTVKCKSCTCEMEQVSQGLTNYEWYKDYYCSTCKITIVKLDKDQNNNGNKITERNF